MSAITQARAVVLSAAVSSPTSKDLVGLDAGLEVEWTSRILLGVTAILAVTAGFLWELGVAFGPRGIGAGTVPTTAPTADLTMGLVGVLLAASVAAFLRLRGNPHRITTIGVLGLLTLAALATMVSSLT